MEEMTIHRALSELKLIDSKIENAIKSIDPIGVNQKGKKVNNRYPEDEFQKNAQSNYDSFNSLIERKINIKNSIVKANSSTTLTVAGKSMTISEAINHKTIISMKKTFLEVLKAKNNHAVGSLNKSNETVKGNLQVLLEKMFAGNKPEKDMLENISTPFMSTNEYHLFDPLKINDKIKAIEEQVGGFESEVDAALSEINAITKVNI